MDYNDRVNTDPVFQ